MSVEHPMPRVDTALQVAENFSPEAGRCIAFSLVTARDT
jgi:hypothetical protein